MGGYTFFFYGTLCDDDVRAAVIGRACPAETAILVDYEAVPVSRGRFPIVLFHRGRETGGIICRDIALEEATRLAFFEQEGRDYTAARLSVRTQSGVARAWVFLPSGRLKRGMGRWDLAEWQRFAKRDFLLRTRHAMRRVEAHQLSGFLELWQGRRSAE